MNTLTKEREQKSLENTYLWLDPDEEQRHMTDKEIPDNNINLDNLCLKKEEEREVMDML